MSKTQGKGTNKKPKRKKSQAQLKREQAEINRKKKEKYREEMCQKVLASIEEGRSLREALKINSLDKYDFYQWRDSSTDNLERYTRARKERQDVLFDEIIEIADTPVEGVKTKVGKDGQVYEERGDMTAHRRLQIEARKWALSKMDPGKYGEKLEVDQKTDVTVSFKDD